MNAKKRDTLNERSLEYGNYSYADYLTWQMEEVVELIKGKIFKKAAAAPGRIHQHISAKLLTRLFVFLEGKPCQVYDAPFDVRFPKASKADRKIHDVVQPDICVICDREKLDDRGCIGSPDLIVEILSPGNSKTELKHKFELYESNGVLEYWIIHAETQDLLIYSLKKGKYVPSPLFTSGDRVESNVIEGFSLDLEEFFGDIEQCTHDFSVKVITQPGNPTKVVTYFNTGEKGDYIQISLRQEAIFQHIL